MNIELQNTTARNETLRFEIALHTANWTNDKQVIALRILNTTVVKQTTIYKAIKALQQYHFKMSEQLTQLSKLFIARQ